MRHSVQKNSERVLATRLIVVCVWCLCMAYPAAGSAHLNLTIYNGMGNVVKPEDLISVNSVIRVRCDHKEPSSYFRYILSHVLYPSFESKILALNNTSDEVNFEQQVSCLKKNNQSIKTFYNVDLTNNTECSLTYLQITTSVTAHHPAAYLCSVKNHGYILPVDESTSQPVLIYSKPSTPTITSEHKRGGYEEGDEVSYICQSKGRPPPRLQLSSTDINMSEGEQRHRPPVSHIPSLNTEKTSSITWKALARKEMNLKLIRCTIVDHPSGSSSYVEELIIVQYTPTSTEHLSTEDVGISERIAESSTASAEHTMKGALTSGDYPIAAIVATTCILIALIFFIAVMYRRSSRESSETTLGPFPSSELPVPRTSKRTAMSASSFQRAESFSGSPYSSRKPSFQLSQPSGRKTSLHVSQRSSRQPSIRSSAKTSRSSFKSQRESKLSMRKFSLRSYFPSK